MFFSGSKDIQQKPNKRKGGSGEKHRNPFLSWWAAQGSNLRPADEESRSSNLYTSTVGHSSAVDYVLDKT